MVKSSYDYTYTSPTGYSYKGQVVADTDITQYNYVPGQTYNAPNGGTYTVSGAGTPTTAPSGAVYQTSYTDTAGKVYDSYHYDVKNAAYYNINAGYDHSTGNYQPVQNGTVPAAPVPAWSGIGLGNEYSYVNTGTPTAPAYHTYGGGGTAPLNLAPGIPAVYDYKFLYPDGSYYLGRVVDDGTYGYAPGKSYTMGTGTYSIYAKDAAAPAPDAKAGYNYIDLYHDASGTNYPPSNLVASSPYYLKPVGYGGVGTEKDWIQKPGGYYQFSDTTTASSSTPVTAIPLPT